MMKKIEVGQVWRKEGPHGWLKVEKIIARGYSDYDGGLVGAVITSFPPQLKGIQLRGGKQYFLSDSPDMSWQEQIRHNRFVLHEWKRGDSVNTKTSVE